MCKSLTLALVLVPSLAAAEVRTHAGWTIIKGIATPGPSVQSLDALDNIKLTFSVTKRGERLNGSGEPSISVTCSDGVLGVFATGTNPPNGPVGRVPGAVGFDGGALKVTQWFLGGNIYALMEEPEKKTLAAQFLTSGQLSLALPTGLS